MRFFVPGAFGLFFGRDVKNAVMAGCSWLSDVIFAVTLFCRFLQTVFLPLTASAALSRSLLTVEVTAEYPIQTVIQLFWAKNEAGCIHNHTSRTAPAPLVFVLVCVCNRLYLFQSV